MKNIKSNLLVLALASIGSMIVLNGCEDPNTTTTAVDTMETINATLWKKVNMEGDAKVTQIVKSGANTYAATDNKGLFYKKADGSWASVDLSTGVEPTTTDVKDLKDDKVEKLTAIAGDRVLFVTAKGVGIAKADKTEAAWDVVPTSVATLDKDGKQTIYAAVGNKLMSQDAAALAKAWTDTNKKADQLVLNQDGTNLLLGLDGGNYLDMAGNVVFKPKSNTPWAQGLPNHAITNANGLIVDTNNTVVFVPTAKPQDGGTEVLKAKVNGFTKDQDNVLVLAEEGVFTIDKDGKKVEDATFDGTFKGANYEFKSKEDFAKIKKADLKAFNIGTKNILDIAFAGDETYYVTADNGVWVGTKANIKVMK